MLHFSSFASLSQIPSRLFGFHEFVSKKKNFSFHIPQKSSFISSNNNNNNNIFFRKLTNSPKDKLQSSFKLQTNPLFMTNFFKFKFNSSKSDFFYKQNFQFSTNNSFNSSSSNSAGNWFFGGTVLVASALIIFVYKNYFSKEEDETIVKPTKTFIYFNSFFLKKENRKSD